MKQLESLSSYYQTIDMLKTLSQLMLLSVFLFSSNAFAQNKSDIANDLGNVTVLTNQNGKETQIYQGYEIKVGLATKTLQGNLYKVEGDELLMFVYDRVQRIKLSEIKYLKTLNPPAARLIGAVLKAFGVVALGFTGLSLAVGVIGLLTGDFAAILLVAVIPLGLLSWIGIKGGQGIAGRKFKMKRWSISAG